MKTTVIHHSADFDGIFCREIARKFLPDAELIGWDFGDTPLSVPREGMVYVLDLPCDRPFGYDISKRELKTTDTLKRFVWIDHHKSSIESHPTEIKGYRIDGVAASRLAWQWFTHGEDSPKTAHQVVLPQKHDFVNRAVSEPLAVRLAGEYDIWDKRDPNAELFQHGLRSREITPWMWSRMLEVDINESFDVVPDLLDAGRALQFARAQEYRDVITQQGFDVQFEGHCYLACNSHELDIRSQLFEAGIKPHHHGLLGFTYNGKDWRVSLYGIPGKDIDHSLTAVKYGGGGHRGACGFHIDKLPFIP